MSKKKTKKKSPKKPGKPADEKVSQPSEQNAISENIVVVPEGPNGPEDNPDTPLPEELPALPIRGTVLFPGTVMPLQVGRVASRRMLDESLPESKLIAVITQRDEDLDQPGPDDMHVVGCVANVLKLVRQPDDTVSIIVHGVKRIRIKEYSQLRPFMKVKPEEMPDKPGKGKNFDAAIAQLRQQAEDLIEATPNAPEQAVTVLMNIDEASNLADFLAANLNLDVQQKQDLLEEVDVSKRARAVHQHVSNQLEIARLQQKIQNDVQSSISDSQRKFYLREQLKAIQRELGEGDETGSDEALEELKRRLAEADPPEAVMKEADRELKRLAVIPPASPEFSVILTYLELIADLPWNTRSEDNLDLKRAREVLDRDHFNLEKVKRRLIEYLAVRKLNPEGRGPILCLVGPPGVGKTSLGQSIADALGRKFARLSLGGIRDEAEVRGHRRTYIGAMPGRIIQEMRRAGTNNPVMMLDEVDKLGSDFRGDPSSALLEVLDPRQNHAFMDRYLDVPFDLSNVIFIATANYIGNIPPALRDRMEVITIPGYTEHDKVEIAKRYLVPRQIEENGLTKSKAKWNVKAIRKVIEGYTREAGVRELERQIGAVCRGVAAEIASGKKKSRTVNPELVREFLGAERYYRDADTGVKEPGVVTGLAYTPYGGEILFIEVTSYEGKGQITLTGQIGRVMKESASTALSLFKSRASQFNYDLADLAKLDVHIHVPAGAVPKDGPSAGIAMFTAITSLLLKVPQKAKLGMTGEVTLRGLVLPIGGIKEKSLAAARAGIKTVILPKQNERDLEDIDKEVAKTVKFKPVENVDEVLELALGKTELKKAIDELGKKCEEKRKRQQQQRKADQKNRAPAASGKVQTVKETIKTPDAK